VDWVVVHRRINDLLTVIASGLGIYLVIMPLLPQLTLPIQLLIDPTQGYHYQSRLAASTGVVGNLQSPPAGNRLVIPRIGVDTEILIGNDPNLLHQGVWHRPLTSTPDQGSNTVLVAHRFQYTFGPTTFYHLDKLREKDRFMIFWEGQEYDYEVVGIKVVDPDQDRIEASTEDPMVTMYTCTPLWTAEKRLVVQAKLIQTD